MDRQEFNGEWQDWSKVPCSSKVGKGFRSGSRDVCECVRAGVYLCMGLPERARESESVLRLGCFHSAVGGRTHPESLTEG